MCVMSRMANNDSSTMLFSMNPCVIDSVGHVWLMMDGKNPMKSRRVDYFLLGRSRMLFAFNLVDLLFTL